LTTRQPTISPRDFFASIRQHALSAIGPHRNPRYRDFITSRNKISTLSTSFCPAILSRPVLLSIRNCSLIHKQSVQVLHLPKICLLFNFLTSPALPPLKEFTRKTVLLGALRGKLLDLEIPSPSKFFNRSNHYGGKLKHHLDFTSCQDVPNSVSSSYRLVVLYIPPSLRFACGRVANHTKEQNPSW
jgi:hypothetical protein